MTKADLRGCTLLALALTSCGGSNATGDNVDGSVGGGADLTMASSGDVDLAFGGLGDLATLSYTCVRQIHVAPGGKDGNSGTAMSPLATISKATPKAMPGDC